MEASIVQVRNDESRSEPFPLNRDASEEGQALNTENQNIFFQFVNCGVLVKAGRSAKTENKVGENVKTNDAWKPILRDVTEKVVGGHMLSIMGPSGSGKSTLLNILTLTPSGGVASGLVTLNGNILDSSMLNEHCAFMPRDDHLWPFLTCKEVLSLAADFYLSTSAQDRKSKVEALLKQLGLEVCANTICGNNLLKGLSGGQKRRLSLGLALIKKPSVLFLDEPTSGLDSASATWIVGFLKRLAKREGIVVICTIHQPSTAVYQQFDRTMLLSEGRVAFCGPAQNANGYFKEVVGKEIPPNYSTAEYVLEIVNSDFGGSEKQSEVEQILEQWHLKNAHDDDNYLTSNKIPLPERKFKPASFLKQVWIHFRREVLLSWRDPIVYVSRMVIFLICCIFFAWVYADARHRVQDQVVNRIFLTMWITAVPTCLAVIAVYAYNQELIELKREVKEGMYSPIAFVLGNTLLQIPLMFVLAITALGVGQYAISNFYVPTFGQVILIYGLALWAFENMAQTLSIVFSNPLVGMLVFICLWFSSFLFAGLFIKEASIQWPLRIFMYIMPHRWFLSGVIKNDIRDSTFEGALLDASPGGPGFRCTSGDGRLCYGYTGYQVLSSLKVAFGGLMDPEDTFGRDCLIVFGIAMVWKLLFALLFVSTNRAAKLATPKVAAEGMKEVKSQK